MIKNMTDSEFQDILFGCSRSGSLKKDINEFVNSHGKVCEVEVKDGESAKNVVSLLRRAAHVMEAPVSVIKRNGLVFLVRTDTD